MRTIRWRRVLPYFYLLIACGCGGGNDPVAPSAPPPPPPAQVQFTDVTEQSQLRFAVGYTSDNDDPFDIPHFSGGAAPGDFDNDGDLDLFVVRGDIGPNLLFRNDGNNQFVDVAANAGVANTRSSTENYRHSGPVFADVDGDRDLDLFIGGVLGDPSLLFANNGDGTFSDVTAASGLDALRSQQTVSAAFGDYDRDGDMDMLLAHWGTARTFQNPGDTEHLWRNDSAGGDITFTSVSIESGLSPSIINLPDPNVVPADMDRTFAPMFVDIDDDEWPDILYASDFNTSQVWLNNRDGTFRNTTDTDVIADTNGMGSAAGDIDNDGDIDWFVTSIYRANNGGVATGNFLYRNDGGAFVDVSVEAGIVDGGWGWAACLIDFENDGDLDIYHVNGWEFEAGGDFTMDSSRAFVSDGNGAFVDLAGALGIGDGGQGRGVVCADFDKDGDTDIFVWNSDATNGARLYQNNESANNYVSVELRGVLPNSQAAGARIYVTTGAKTQLREVSIGSNFVSHNPTVQIFGLGTSSQADLIRIVWPDGVDSELGVVAANQILVVDYPQQGALR